MKPHPQSAFHPPPQKGVKIVEGGQQPQKTSAEPATAKGKGKAPAIPDVDPTLKMRQAASLARQSKFTTASEATQKVFTEATIRDLGFCETRDIMLTPRESYATKSKPDSVMDLPVFLEAFSWKIFNLSLSIKEYNEFLIRFYSQIGQDQDLVWKKTYITRLKVNRMPEKFEGLLQNYRFVLERGSKKESQSVTLADLPLMNPYDIFSMYTLSGTIQGTFPDEFRGFLRNFLRQYIQTVSVRDMVICACLKGSPDAPNLKISKEAVNAIQGDKDRRIVHEPEWGIVFHEKLPKSRSVKYNLARVDEKSFFSNQTLTDLLRRLNKNDDNTEKDQREMNDMIFWWMAVRSFLKREIPRFFEETEIDRTKL